MSPASSRVGEQRPGGRAARVRAGVLQATAELLMEAGYGDLAVEAVAARAGVHKTTIYRRWPTKPELVADAVMVHIQSQIPVPDSGTLAGDLQALARAVVAHLGSDGGSLLSRSIIAAAAESPELAATVHRFWASRMASSQVIVDRAVERGEIPASADPVIIVESLVAPIWLRLLVTGEAIDNDLADHLAALVAAGAKHCVASSGPVSS